MGCSPAVVSKSGCRGCQQCSLQWWGVSGCWDEHPLAPYFSFAAAATPSLQGSASRPYGIFQGVVSKVLFYFSLNLRDGCCLLSFCQCPLWASVLLARGEAAFQLGYIRLALFQGINFQILDFHVYLFLIRSAWECACRQLPWEGFFPSSPSTFKEEGMPLISSWFYGALSKVIICWCCFN